MKIKAIPRNRRSKRDRECARIANKILRLGEHKHMCVCTWDEKGNVISGCGAHYEWARREYAQRKPRTSTEVQLRCAKEAIRAHVRGTEAILNWYREWLPGSWILNYDNSGRPFVMQSVLSYFLMEDCNKRLEEDER